MPQHQRRSSGASESNTQSNAQNSGSEHEEQALVGNQTIVDIIRAQNSPTGARDQNPNKNGIVYLGLNHYAHDESRALNQYNRDKGGAVSARPLQEQDHITKGGVKYDLRTPEGSASFE